MLRARPVRPLIAVLLAVLTTLFAVSCGDDNGAGGSGGSTEVDVSDSEFTDETGKTAVTVDSADNTFEPTYVEITAGTDVTWDNVGRIAHNVIPVDEGSFTGVPVADFGPGQVYTETLDEPGDYPYYCSLHGTKQLKGMAGVVRVVAAE